MIFLESIYKSFDGHNVLSNVNISLKKGSRSALMGPSGCGKTTLFRIIAGLEEPDSGNISGTENMLFSAVFQDDRLCENMSLYANLKLVCPKNTKRSDILEDIKKLGLSGYENKPVSTLSGGMKRRASIIRAMLAEFDTLILDEPLNGLDLVSKKITIDYILEKLGARTLVLITHNPEDAELLGCECITLNK